MLKDPCPVLGMMFGAKLREGKVCKGIYGGSRSIC